MQPILKRKAAVPEIQSVDQAVAFSESNDVGVKRSNRQFHIAAFDPVFLAHGF